MQSGSWKGSIREHRRRIQLILKDSPSLKSYVTNILCEAYAEALAGAIDETGLEMLVFPADCPYSILDVLDPDFLPNL